MSCHAWPWSAVFLSLVLAGCNNASKPASPTTKAESTDADGVTEAKPVGTSKGVIPVRQGVTTFDGNWALLMTIPEPQPDGNVVTRDWYSKIIGFTKDADGKYSVKIVDSVTADAQLEQATIEGKSVLLVIKEKQFTLNFQGEFDGIAVRGTLANGLQHPYLARLLPTEALHLADYVPSAFPPAADIFKKVIQQMQNHPQINVMLELIHQQRTSPVALETAANLVQAYQKAGFDDTTVKAIFGEYVTVAKVWGARMQLFAEFMCAKQLVNGSRLPDEALKHLDAAESLVTVDVVMPGNEEPWKRQIEFFRESANIQRSLERSHSKADEVRAAADEELRDGLKRQPFNPEVLLALAEYTVATKQLDAARDYYSTLVALPLLEQYVLMKRSGQPAGDPKPSDVLKKLWIERFGNEEGLEAHLAAINKERIDGLRAEIRKNGPPPLPPDTGDHTVLVEFFTSTQMWAAVATEIAMDALRETYPSSKLITLRYHQHIPAPDGMVNQDSEDRIASYEMARVPVIALDGAVPEPEQLMYSGLLQVSQTAYNNLRMIIDPRLKQTTPVRIELEGKVVDGELSIQAVATGVNEELLPSCRLRLAIAEEDVFSIAPNGIRHHALVVREMPGGAKGIAPKKGELKYSLTIPLSELQKHLDDYLNRYEAGRGIQIPPAAKPPIRGQLYLVGWVQNDKMDEKRPEVGRAVLQSVIVPVSGTGTDTLPHATDSAPESAAIANPASLTPPPPPLPE